MVDPTTATILVAIISVIGGGLGKTAIDSWNSRKKTNIEFASQIRSEQRSEIMNLRATNNDLNAEIEDIREKYYEVLQKKVDLEAQIDDLQFTLTERGS